MCFEGILLLVAENKGFEPLEACTSPVFKTGAFDQLSQLSISNMVRMVGIEPTLRNRNGILSPTRLPIPPHSHAFMMKYSSKGK